MFFWPILIDDHQCSVMPTDRTSVKYEYSRSLNHAAYDKTKVTFKIAICPICDREYKYDPIRENCGRVSYKEIYV